MEENSDVFTEDIYSKHLSTINNVKFTPREIDVMACLLNARRTSQIASMLSIAPRTVTTHFRNIMLRLDCNSQEGIINFVERSHKLSILREYYFTLIIELAFKKALKEISKLKKDEIASCLIVYWQDHNLKNAFLHHLENHLSEAGISTEIREQEIDQQVENTEKSKKVLLLLVEKKDQQEFPSEWLEFISVDLSQQQNYYFSVFKMIKALLPNANLGKNILEFKERFEIRLSTFDQTHLQKEPCIDDLRQTSNDCNFVKRVSSQTGAAINELVCQENAVVSLPSETESIRSDLFGPATEMLLQRPQIICQIEEKLSGQQGIQTIALIGPGGAGKTTIARQYGRSQKLSVVWEINAETNENLINSFECLAYTLSKTKEEKKILKGLQEIQNAEERGEKIISFVKERLKLRPNWLLLYDNVEKFTDIQKCFPSDPLVWGQGKIIVTTRNENIKSNNSINQTLIIGELDQTDRLNLFMKIMGNDKTHHFTPAQKEQTQAFLNKIPPFPLDVSVAAYYLKATNISYAKYLENLGQYDQEFENLQECILRDASEYNKTRHNIITLSLKCLMETHKDFMDLLLFISLLDSKCILRDLLVAYKGDIVVDNFIYNLKKYSFLTNESCNLSHPLPLISIHRSTQEISLAYLTKTLNLEKDHQLLKLIANILENYTVDIIQKEDFSSMKFLVSHCEMFLSHNILLNNIIKGTIGRRLGCIYFYLGNYIKSKQILEDGLVSLNRYDGENYISMAQILVHLGLVYREHGNYDKAKDFLEEGLMIYQNHLSENHSEIAWALTHLGNVYREHGNYDKAKDVLEQCLVIYKKQLSANHVGKALVLAYLGNVYRNLGNYGKARDLLEQSLVIYKECFLGNYVGAARALANLGIVYRSLGEYEKAIDLLEQSHLIYMSSDNHSGIVRTLVHLGIAYRGLGEYKKAKDLLKQSLTLYKKHLPENHMYVAWVLTHLGSIYRKLGDYEKAKDLLEQSLTLYKEHLPENHIYFSRVSTNLGSVYKELGNYERAKTFFEKTLIAYEKNYGNDHIETAWVLRNLGQVYLLKDDLKTAENLVSKSCSIFQKNKHPDSSYCLESLAKLYMKKSINAANKNHIKQSQIFKKQAIDFLKQALEIVKAHFPENSSHSKRIESKLRKIE